MSFIDSAKRLQQMGFYVFPLVPNGKAAAVAEFSQVASRDPWKVEAWWRCPVLGVARDYNIGISPSRFSDNERLVIVDIDDKNGKDGFSEMFALEAQGKIFPSTFN